MALVLSVKSLPWLANNCSVSATLSIIAVAVIQLASTRTVPEALPTYSPVLSTPL